jgi:small subunit ribosomal protein S8
MAKEKLTKAEQIRRLREVTADEDKYFTGVLGNPVALAARWGVPLSKRYHSSRKGNVSSTTAHEIEVANTSILDHRRPPIYERSKAKAQYVNDPISDMLTRIRNAGAASLPAVELPHSRIRESVAKILKAEGYVSEVAVEGVEKKKLRICLKFDGKTSVIGGIKRINRPGLRRYVGATQIPRVRGGTGVTLVSTSEGLLTEAEARKKNLGGELLHYVW